MLCSGICRFEWHKFRELHLGYGHWILITRRGQPIAKIIPLAKDLDNIAIINAIARIRKLGKEMQLGKFNWEEGKSYRDMDKR